jgi:hypothetical protein
VGLAVGIVVGSGERNLIGVGFEVVGDMVYVIVGGNVSSRVGIDEGLVDRSTVGAGVGCMVGELEAGLAVEGLSADGKIDTFVGKY